MTKVLFLMWLADIASVIAAAGIICTAGLMLGVITVVVPADEDVSRFFRNTKVLRWLTVVVVVAALTPSASTIRLAAAAVAVDVAASTALGTKAAETLEAVLSKIKTEASK